MKKQIICLSLLAALAISCEQKMEVAPPSNITEEQVLELLKKDAGAVLDPMVASMEDRLVSAYFGKNHISYKNFQNFNLAHSMRGNDVVFVPTADQRYYRDDYKMIDYRTAGTAHQDRYWGLNYNHIYTANTILDMLPDEIPNDANGTKMKRHKASALTLRAYAYTYLMWVYADDYLNSNKSAPGVPLYTTVTRVPQDRASSTEVWEQVIADATEAARLYKEIDYKASAKLEDFDGAVANLVLARAAITAGEWKKAEDAADEVAAIHGGWKLMNRAVYVSTPATRNGFSNRTANTEALLAYDYAKTKPGTSFGGTSFAGWMNIYGSGQGGELGGYVAIDKRLYDQIDGSDYRKENFLKADQVFKYESVGAKGTTATLTKYMNTKFACLLGPTPSDPNSIQDEIVMRTSEALLIKAEAQYRGGNEAGARTTLAELISARTEGAVTSVTASGDALFKLIQLQTRIELWGENGSEFYNNKRWNISLDRRGGKDVTNHTEVIDQVMEPKPNYTYQLPLIEINYNSNITVLNP